VVTFIRSRRLFVAVSVVALAVIALNFNTYYSRIVTANEQEGSTSRLDIWAMNLQHVENHPLFGMGPAGYAPYNMHYHPQDARSTHNNYFDVLAQNGIVGMISFVALWATLTRICLRNVRATHTKRDFEAGFSAATLAGCLAALVAMALGDWVLPFAYNQTITGFDNASYTWMMLGCAAALEIIRRTRSAQPAAVLVAPSGSATRAGEALGSQA
jgi:O-antigen ligase